MMRQVAQALYSRSFEVEQAPPQTGSFSMYPPFLHFYLAAAKLPRNRYEPLPISSSSGLRLTILSALYKTRCPAGTAIRFDRTSWLY
jgi:hypothetical protein